MRMMRGSPVNGFVLVYHFPAWLMTTNYNLLLEVLAIAVPVAR